MQHRTLCVAAAAAVGVTTPLALADATGQELTAFMNFSPDGGPFDAAEEVLGSGPMIFGTPGVFATTSEDIDLILETSEIDLGGGLHELTFNFTAVDAVGAPSAFTMTIPADVYAWGISGLSWGDNSSFEIIGDENDLFFLSGAPLGDTVLDLFAGQTGDVLDFATPLFAGGADLTAFSIARYEIRMTILEVVPAPGILAIFGLAAFGSCRRRHV